MTYTFLKNDFYLSGSMSSKKDYDDTMKILVKNITLQTSTKPSALFTKELEALRAKRALTESTVWGGVTLKKVDVAKDYIEKLLIIQQHGVLGFEIHKKKLEKLKILEGICLVLFVNHKNHNSRSITIKLAGPGDRFTFHPNDEHGILALSDCVIQETSTNHLDDLVYIFQAGQV